MWKVGVPQTLPRLHQHGFVIVVIVVIGYCWLLLGVKGKAIGLVQKRNKDTVQYALR